MSFLNLTEVKTTSFAPLPEGKYNVISDNVELKETKSGTGEYIAVTFRILDGDAEGRKIFENYNIKNSNPKAVEIGLAKLKEFMTCAGAKSLELKSVFDLVGYKATAVVKHRQDDRGETRAVISYFKPIEAVEVDKIESSDIPF